MESNIEGKRTLQSSVKIKQNKPITKRATIRQQLTSNVKLVETRDSEGHLAAKDEAVSIDF